MIKVGILGATGYAGIELVRILSQHTQVQIVSLVSQSFAGRKIYDIYPNLQGVVDLVCEELNIEEIAGKCDLVFTALPHGISKEVIPNLTRLGLKVIDLSGDFRYKDVSVYEKWYGMEHGNPELLKDAVYGLPELHRNEIKNAYLVGNPGCYTTCSILGLVPLLDKELIYLDNIIIDAKSGVSGAGRNVSLDYHFCECTENMKAYKIATHRHTSEIEQELSLVANTNVQVSFTPHLVPMKRGILSTMYANLKESLTTSQVLDIFKDYYKGEYFIRIYDEGHIPEVNHVTGSNFVDIGLVVDERLNRVVVVAAIDNLIKGAAGQAVQNMNIMFGLDEKKGLTAPGLYI
ncbi:MAG: N-acetyl-gamma-glutamyl-phosphate reductase [Clostridiaceae bacterium]|nr:N-acetyl-gamma-glutamyl-phosphate reductase [Clostridiaceae bacterium]